MQTHIIRISDSKDNVLNVKISDILEEIQKGNDLNWCILFLDGMPSPGKGNTVNDYKNKINKSKEGLQIKWNDICFIENEFFQIFETIILGCKNQEFLHRYDNDQEMYQSCDIVIELIDCAFWQIFTKDQDLKNRRKRAGAVTYWKRRLKSFKMNSLVWRDSQGVICFG